MEAAMDIENANCKLRVSQCTDMEILPIERPIKVDREIDGLEKLVAELHRVFSHDHVNVQDVQKLMTGYTSDPKHWKKYAKFDRFRYTRNLVDAGNGAFNIMILCWAGGHASAIHDHADSHCFMKMLSGSLEEVRYDWPDNVQPEVLKKLKSTTKARRRCCSESEDKYLSSKMNALDMNCQNDSCHNFGGSIDNDHAENGNGNVEKENGSHCKNGEDRHEVYEAQNMVEIGRTRLEVNDVCYINDALGLHRMENPSHVDAAVSLHLYCPPFDSCRVFDASTGKPTQVSVTFTSKYGKRIKRMDEVIEVADSQQ
ncbi:unnamed protein product [Plutella xylostella]|uniref:Cysteine dioxygenase n=1 Tax=Plutella xylostella TaxID=51655 RepID=A0A8S4G5B1_PLUXY|nr:unnamed protein product [Plutella xylostella]